MKFKVEGGGLPVPELERDYRASRDLGKVRLGARCLYFPKLSGVSCLPYGEIARAYLRQEEVNAKLCCGRASFDQFFLMVQGRDGTMYRGQVLNKDVGKQALAHISQADPQAEIGYRKPAQV